MKDGSDINRRFETERNGRVVATRVNKLQSHEWSEWKKDLSGRKSRTMENQMEDRSVTHFCD